jgi:hypothetical protein
MTCIVLTKNPNGGGIVAITEGDEGNIARWSEKEQATADALDHPLVKAWGGWIVDLDELEVHEV